MTTAIVIDNTRVKPLVDQLSDKVKVIGPYDNNSTLLEVTLNDALDVLSVFHAGIRYGMDRDSWGR